jgi:hypothetical protein
MKKFGFLDKVLAHVLMFQMMAFHGLFSFGPVLGTIMAVIVWGLFFKSMTALAVLVIPFAYLGAFLHDYCGTFPDGMPRKQFLSEMSHWVRQGEVK